MLFKSASEMPPTGIYTTENRWADIKRDYSPADVQRLRGSLKIEYTLAKRGAEKLWAYVTQGGSSYINSLGALTGKFRLF